VRLPSKEECLNLKGVPQRLQISIIERQQLELGIQFNRLSDSRLRLLDVVDDAEDAVMFVEVDADIKRPAWLVRSLAHKLPFYTIDYVRFRSSKRL